MVRSKGYNNIWSEPAQFSFSIVPPWWKTWWAYLLYGLLAILILYSIIQYRSQWLKKENRILEERVSERTAQLQKSIHDLENTQAQLIQSEKMASLGELTAGIAHEIQNPLNFVNNFSEVNSELIDELRQERLKDKQERDLELEDELLFDIAENEKKIRHHGQRADAIVKGMLQHSRNSSTEKELTDINKLADEYLRLSYHGLRAKDKTFNAGMKTDFDESLPKIYVAPQDIGRVFLNLINNAFYAVSERKRTTSDENYQPMVIVSTEKAGKFININIIDNGRGIPSEVQEKIFQPFFTTKPSGQGTGLGLSLSYDIIKTHGGILKLKTQSGVPVTSNGYGEEIIEEGTTFTIQLPANLKKKH
ncbi:GHKL domain-containing protein [Gramella sp. MT6]|nr:GHKL domain-containing protein [Gramella sp. MT6]